MVQYRVVPKVFKQKGCPRNGQPVFSGMKNYAFHLAQGDISIRIMRMAMVIGTIGKADVYFMDVILGMRGYFVNGGFGKNRRLPKLFGFSLPANGGQVQQRPVRRALKRIT
ncbi:MAG: hypothetical protein IPP55_01540 [Anaerolineales bacterium]|nr:hypothetical protein [Anaerolineales bacterium]